MLFWRPRRCSCICRRLMALGCPAGVLLAEGGGGPDTGVAPLLRLPDPQAAVGPQGWEKNKSGALEGLGQGPPHTVATEACDSDPLPQMVVSPSVGGQGKAILG